MKSKQIAHHRNDPVKGNKDGSHDTAVVSTRVVSNIQLVGLSRSTRGSVRIESNKSIERKTMSCSYAVK